MMTPIIVSFIFMAIGYGLVAWSTTRFFRLDDLAPENSILLMFVGSILGSISGLCFIIFLVHYLFF